MRQAEKAEGEKRAWNQQIFCSVGRSPPPPVSPKLSGIAQPSLLFWNRDHRALTMTSVHYTRRN